MEVRLLHQLHKKAVVVRSRVQNCHGVAALHELRLEVGAHHAADALGARAAQNHDRVERSSGPSAEAAPSSPGKCMPQSHCEWLSGYPEQGS